jgi:hypothetical protein
VIRHDLFAAYFVITAAELLRNLSKTGKLCRSTASIPTSELVNE